MGQTVDFKSFIIKIVGSEKQESDLLFMFFTSFNAQEPIHSAYIDMK